MQRDPGQPQRSDIHPRTSRQPQSGHVAAHQVVEQVHAGVPRADDKDVPPGHLAGVPELPGVEEPAGIAGHPRPARHHRLGVRAGGDHHMRRSKTAVTKVQLPPRARPVDPAHGCTELEAHPRRVPLKVGDIVVTSGIRPVPAGDTQARLMGEHPVRVQPKLIMPRPPRRGHRGGPLDDQRISARPPDRPRRSKPRRAGADHHHTLIHAASLPAAGTGRQPVPAVTR